MKGTCKLCEKESTLLKTSHILPDFIFRDLNLYSSEHRIDLLKIKKSPSLNFQHSDRPTGEYEKGILCSSCDNNILGGYESYAKKAMFGGELQEQECPMFKNYIDRENNEYLHVERISYVKFKLFMLSLLWRMSISSRPMFSQVNLNCEINESLRNMVLTGHPGKVNDFPIYGMTYLNDKSIPNDIVGQPYITEVKGFTIIRILIGGIFLAFHISVGVQSEIAISDLVLNDKNEWNVFYIKEGEGWDYFFKHMSL
jgi:hypothetical protein